MRHLLLGLGGVLFFLSGVPNSGAEVVEGLFACGVKIREGEPEKFKCLKSSGNTALNAKAYSQTRHLNGAFNMKVQVCFIDDEPPNAWARTDKKVFIGRNLIRKEFEEHGNIALLGVLAHEWAHQWQFENDQNALQYGVLAELQADCVAGYHLARIGKVEEEEIASFGKSLFSKGDYAFNSPTHHGTPETRLSSMMSGYKTGREQKIPGKDVFLRCFGEVSSHYAKQKKPETIRTLQ